MYLNNVKGVMPIVGIRGGPAMNRVGLAANEYKSGELESVKSFAADGQFLFDSWHGYELVIARPLLTHHWQQVVLNQFNRANAEFLK